MAQGWTTTIMETIAGRLVRAYTLNYNDLMDAVALGLVSNWDRISDQTHDALMQIRAHAVRNPRLTRSWMNQERIAYDYIQVIRIHDCYRLNYELPDMLLDYIYALADFLQQDLTTRDFQMYANTMAFITRLHRSLT